MISPLHQKLKGKKLILASGSPRRHELMEQLGLEFEVRTHPVEEIFPPTLFGKEIPEFLSKIKAEPLLSTLGPDDILITADTIVWHRKQILGKPTDIKEAREMLRKLSNNTHKVISALCITTIEKQLVLSDETEVTFKKLSEEEITFYTSKFRPLDKAGAYGIQEWIGLIGVEKLNGSYLNVVGLPTQLLYKTLTAMAG